MTQSSTKGVPIDTDPTLAANSNQLVCSQAAIKTYVGVTISGAALPVTATANQILLSQSLTAPVWSTTTLPATNVLGDILYSSAANVLSNLAGNITTAKQYLSQTGNGSISAAPVWATITGSDITGAALTNVDDTNVTLTLGGTPTTALLRAASLTLGWTGQLSVARGGTGVASLTAYSVVCGGTTSTGAVQSVSGVGTSGQVLTSNGAAALPTWQTSATNWVAYTPTITGFGTATDVEFWSRRDGDSLEIRGRFTSGTSTGVEARMSIGYNGTNNNVTSSSTKITSIQFAGAATFSQATTAATQPQIIIEAGVQYCTFGLQSATTGGLSKVLGNAFMPSGRAVSFLVNIPIDTWP